MADGPDDPGGATGGTILDDPAAMRRIDRRVLDAVAGSGADEDAWRSRSTARSARPRSAALLGMGGSAIGGDLVRGIWSDRLRVPLEVVRGYDLPAWVGGETLVVASSYSGSTEETISAFTAAIERRCPVAVITTGGPLGEVARRAGLPLLTFTGRARRERRSATRWRSSRGSSSAPASCRSTRPRSPRPSRPRGRWRPAAGPDVPTADNPAKQLAWSLVDRLVVIGASGALAPVARRWKAQLNENSKSAAVVEELPEATHNTVVGFEQPDSMRDHLFVVFLASGGDLPRNAARRASDRRAAGFRAHRPRDGAGRRRWAARPGAVSDRPRRPRERVPRVHVRDRPEPGHRHRSHQVATRRGTRGGGAVATSRSLAAVWLSATLGES